MKTITPISSTDFLNFNTVLVLISLSSTFFFPLQCFHIKDTDSKVFWCVWPWILFSNSLKCAWWHISQTGFAITHSFYTINRLGPSLHSEVLAFPIQNTDSVYREEQGTYIPYHPMRSGLTVDCKEAMWYKRQRDRKTCTYIHLRTWTIPLTYVNVLLNLSRRDLINLEWKTIWRQSQQVFLRAYSRKKDSMWMCLSYAQQHIFGSVNISWMPSCLKKMLCVCLVTKPRAYQL